MWEQTAAYNRQLSIVEYLLQIGADVDSSDVGARLVCPFYTLCSYTLKLIFAVGGQPISPL